MSVLSGWCGQHGKPAHQWCRSLVCACELCGHPWRENAARSAALVRDPGGGLRENGATSKSAPAGVGTPVAPGLTATKERLT